MNAVSEVLKTLGGLEPLEEYKSRTGNTVLRGLRQEDPVTAFIQRDPWIEEIETVVVDGAIYLKK